MILKCSCNVVSCDCVIIGDSQKQVQTDATWIYSVDIRTLNIETVTFSGVHLKSVVVTYTLRTQWILITFLYEIKELYRIVYDKIEKLYTYREKLKVLYEMEELYRIVDDKIENYTRIERN